MENQNENEERIEKMKKLLYENSLVSFKIKTIYFTDGCNPGDNYMSIVTRLEIVGYNKDETTWMIIKEVLTNKARSKLFRCPEAFKNEINAYKNIVPILEEYMDNTIFPICLHCGQDNNIIVLQDLKKIGFCMHNRLIGLELNYCKLVMKQLAYLHAASIAAKHLGPSANRAKFKEIKDIVYEDDAKDWYKSIIDYSIKQSLKSLKQSNDDCLREPIHLIEELNDELYAKIKTWITKSEEHINVVCHGDLWVNNIMFAVDAPSSTNELDSEQLDENVNISANRSSPSDVQFLDLQAMRYTSPVFDILHFVHTSTTRDLRDLYTEQLLKTYCEALKENLKKHFKNSLPELNTLLVTYSLRNITDEYYKYILYGLMIAMWILPAVTFHSNNIPNLDQKSEKTNSVEEINFSENLTLEFHSRIKDLALEFYEKGYLNKPLKNNG